jgi:PAS domain-containing protein
VEAQRAVRDSQDLARHTIDAISSHVCVLDETGVILTVNQAWKDFAEANPRLKNPGAYCTGPGANYLETCERAIGAGAVEAAEFAAGIRAVLKRETPQFSMEYMEYACHSPGEERWFIGRVTFFSSNQLPRILVEHINITDRKLAEQVLQTSEQKFRELAENIREVFWIMNSDATQMIYVSPAYETVWGRTSEHLYADS